MVGKGEKIFKNKIVLVVIICCFGLVACINDTNEKYWSGKDTYLSVGDGQFQILSTPIDYSLFDWYKDNPIFQDISEYYDDYDNSLLYLVNRKNKYLVLDYKNKQYKKYKNENLSAELKAIFESDHMRKLEVKIRETRSGPGTEKTDLSSDIMQ